ncbi:MAG: hypothetical protein ACQES4_09920 [Bacillota bacterium]
MPIIALMTVIVTSENKKQNSHQQAHWFYPVKSIHIPGSFMPRIHLHG